MKRPTTLDPSSAERNKVPIWNMALQQEYASLLRYKLESCVQRRIPPPEQDKQHGDKERKEEEEEEDRPPSLCHYATVQDPKESTVICIRTLEVAAGTGVHTLFFQTQLQELASHFQKEVQDPNIQIQLQWYPTDPDEESRQWIQSKRNQYLSEMELLVGDSHPQQQHARRPVESIFPIPFSLTLNQHGIQEQQHLNPIMPKFVDCIVCINMIHIAPWEATFGLFQMAATILSCPRHHSRPTEERKEFSPFLFLYGPFLRNGTAVPSNLAFDTLLQSKNPQWGLRHLEHVEQVATQYGFVLKKVLEMPANNLAVVFHFHL